MKHKEEIQIRLLILLSSHEFDKKYEQHARSSIETIKEDSAWSTVDVCAIGSTDDFLQYKIDFKYTFKSNLRQLSKITEFFAAHPEVVSCYDWFLKLRPDIELHQCIDVTDLRKDTIYARAREYHGPRHILYGASFSRSKYPGYFASSFRYAPKEQRLVLDDQLYLFHADVVKHAFAPVADQGQRQDEWFHDAQWRKRKVPMDVIGLHITFLREKFSSDNF